ncbi:MAG: two-component system sensor histidine kinase HydH [Planctomycetota bacterium]|jgi:two-component system sensor histidine kinase HydH
MDDPAFENLRGTRPSQEHEALLARLAGGLAHEIKNPLSTMAINLTLLEEEWERPQPGDADLSPRDKRCLKRVRTLSREVTRLEGIVDDFLRFARGGEVNRSPLDLISLVRNTLEFLEPEHTEANIRVHVDLPTKLPLVMVDSGAIEQALMNLLVNARHAMEGGGELIVQLRREGNFAELTITDTGVGMGERELEHCFELYWSTKRKGTGLGLPTVARIIDEHEGTIEVVSEAGRGTNFRIMLPLVVELAGRVDDAREQSDAALEVKHIEVTTSNSMTTDAANENPMDEHEDPQS